MTKTASDAAIAMPPTKPMAAAPRSRLLSRSDCVCCFRGHPIARRIELRIIPGSNRRRRACPLRPKLRRWVVMRLAKNAGGVAVVPGIGMIGDRSAAFSWARLVIEVIQDHVLGREAVLACPARAGGVHVRRRQAPPGGSGGWRLAIDAHTARLGRLRRVRHACWKDPGRCRLSRPMSEVCRKRARSLKECDGPLRPSKG